MLRLMTGRIAVCLLLAASASYAQDGAAVFQSKCSVCHAAGGATQAPLPDALRRCSETQTQMAFGFPGATTAFATPSVVAGGIQ